MRRLRRRTIGSVIWALGLGAMTTTAIAWGFALGVDSIYHAGQTTMRRSPRVAWNVREYPWYGALTEDWSALDWYCVAIPEQEQLSPASQTAIADSIETYELNISNLFESPGIMVSTNAPRVVAYEQLWTADGPSNLTEHHRGWPFLALSCARVVEPVPKAADSSAVDDGWRWGVILRNGRTASWDVDCLALPLKPLFPGFYLDTALFASVWWALLFWRPLRRRRRIARGQCAACAYSLAGLPPGTDKCPECGSPTPAAVATKAVIKAAPVAG